MLIKSRRAECTNVVPHYLIDMTDIEVENFLNYQPLNLDDENIHHGFNQWSGAAFLESHVAAPVHANNSDDIEHIYIGLHKCIDQVVAKITVRTPPRLHQIREQNRKLIDKLTTLESAITEDATAIALSSGSRTCPTASALNLARVRSGGKRRRVSQSTGPQTASASIQDTPSVSPFLYQRRIHIACCLRLIYSQLIRGLDAEVPRLVGLKEILSSLRSCCKLATRTLEHKSQSLPHT